MGTNRPPAWGAGNPKATLVTGPGPRRIRRNVARTRRPLDTRRRRRARTVLAGEYARIGLKMPPIW